MPDVVVALRGQAALRWAGWRSAPVHGSEPTQIPEDCVLVDCSCRGRIRRSRVLGLAAFRSAKAEAAWHDRARRVGAWRPSAYLDRVFAHEGGDTPCTGHRAA